LTAFQSNHEGVLIDRVHAARTDGTQFVIINPGAFTHTSVALRDAFAGVAIPFIEVHLSNVHRREPFRHHSYFSDIAEGVIVGLGAKGYHLALDAALDRLSAASAPAKA
ncbi:MAG: type 3-dehydroquinate dehydratase, partial [Pseudomonadota bacterium]